MPSIENISSCAILNTKGGSVDAAELESTEDVCTAEGLWALGAPVLKKHTNVDGGHHGPLSCIWFFYAETFKKTRQGDGKVIQLDFCEEHSME